jgi:hypothetical protein
MGSSGSCGQVTPGETCPNGMVSGVWWRVVSTAGGRVVSGSAFWRNLQAEGDAQGELDWEVHFVDGSIVRAHQRAAGAKKRLQKQKR